MSLLAHLSFWDEFLRLRRKHQTDELATNNNRRPAATPTNSAMFIFVVPSLFPFVGLLGAMPTVSKFACVDFSVVSLPMYGDVGKLISGGVVDLTGMVGEVVGNIVEIIRETVVGMLVVAPGVVGVKKLK